MGAAPAEPSGLLDFRRRICYGARGQDGFRDATREEERRRAPHRGEVVPIGSPCEQRRTCWGSERLHFAPGPQSFLTGRAIRVPHPRVNPGTQRTTTVTAAPPTSWSSSPDQQEGIPRICLIRMRSQVQGRQQPWLCLALEVPRDGYLVGDLLRQRRDAKPNVGLFDVIARGAGVPVCLGRSGARLAGCGWLGQGFQQRPDLGVGVASVAAQGPEIRQPALLCPASDRLWRHLEELGDLGCT